MSNVAPVFGKKFESNRFGFICALSRKESHSDLTKDDSFYEPWTSRENNDGTDNRAARTSKNQFNYMGLFQFGDAALKTIGYKDDQDKWTGLDGAYTESDFLSSRSIQIKAVNRLIDKTCKLLRNNNINEYYGKIINRIEVTESGAIAACHLLGLGGLAAFLNVDKLKYNKKGELHKQYDGNNIHVSEYLKLFNYYDLESCCPRKIYVSFYKGSIPVVGEKVVVKSKYNGKLINEEMKVEYFTDSNGLLPVIIRHPGAKINISIGDIECEEIIQDKVNIQKCTFKMDENFKIQEKLESDNKPEKKDVVNKTPQENRGGDELKDNHVLTKIVNFNIKIVDPDSNNGIPNLKYFIVYKGKAKAHLTDKLGLDKNIKAEEGQDLEFNMRGHDDELQPFSHFKVSASMEGQTITIKLPVHSFKLKMIHINTGSPVVGLKFQIEYRDGIETRISDKNGLIDVRMLTGFVYRLVAGDLKGKFVRCVKSTHEQVFEVSDNYIKYSDKLINSSLKKIDNKKDNSNKNQEASIFKVDLNAIGKIFEKQVNVYKPEIKDTHTEMNGKPLTVIGGTTKSSDTVNYIIYPDGSISRENGSALGYAAFYFVIDDTPELIGKSKIYVADTWEKKGVKGKGKSYLVSIREIFGDNAIKYKARWTKSLSKVNIDIYNDTTQQLRFWMSMNAFAAYIGAVCVTGGISRYSGFSTVDGGPGDSKEHINGNVGDLGYIRTDLRNDLGNKFPDPTYDHDATLKFVNALIKFGWGKTKEMYSEYYPTKLTKRYDLKTNYILPNCKNMTVPRHNNHLHVKGLDYEFKSDT